MFSITKAKAKLIYNKTSVLFIGFSCFLLMIGALILAIVESYSGSPDYSIVIPLFITALGVPALMEFYSKDFTGAKKVKLEGCCPNCKEHVSFNLVEDNS